MGYFTENGNTVLFRSNLIKFIVVKQNSIKKEEEYSYVYITSFPGKYI